MDQIKPVLEWIKAHLMISAMCLLVIAFIFCGWYFSGGLKEQLASDVQARTKEFQKLDKAAKTSVSLPMTDGDFTANGTLNKNLLDKNMVIRYCYLLQLLK